VEMALRSLSASGQRDGLRFEYVRDDFFADCVRGWPCHHGAKLIRAMSLFH
jgi:hypothetical protein